MKKKKKNDRHILQRLHRHNNVTIVENDGKFKGKYKKDIYYMCPIRNVTACKLMEKSAIMGLPCHYSICLSQLMYSGIVGIATIK